MSSHPGVQTVEKSDDYYHVRYRDPDAFSTLRTPDWAANAAGSVAEGSEVRMGARRDDDWEIQSVLIPVERADEAEAKRLANETVEKIKEELPANRQSRFWPFAAGAAGYSVLLALA